jgi:hypothetical protein
MSKTKSKGSRKSKSANAASVRRSREGEKLAMRAGAPKATKATPKSKRISGLDLAARAVMESKQPLNAKAITEKAIAAGWKTSGKTPHATLYAAIIREIADKGKEARFCKAGRGLFTATKGA